MDYSSVFIKTNRLLTYLSVLDILRRNRLWSQMMVRRRKSLAMERDPSQVTLTLQLMLKALLVG